MRALGEAEGPCNPDFGVQGRLAEERLFFNLKKKNFKKGDLSVKKELTLGRRSVQTEGTECTKSKGKNECFWGQKF